MDKINLLLLKEKRLAKGFTQKKLSDLLEVDIATYSRKEHGKIQFKLSEVSILKKKLELNSDEVCKIFL